MLSISRCGSLLNLMVIFMIMIWLCNHVSLFITTPCCVNLKLQSKPFAQPQGSSSALLVRSVAWLDNAKVRNSNSYNYQLQLPPTTNNMMTTKLTASHRWRANFRRNQIMLVALKSSQEEQEWRRKKEEGRKTLSLILTTGSQSRTLPKVRVNRGERKQARTLARSRLPRKKEN